MRTITVFDCSVCKNEGFSPDEMHGLEANVSGDLASGVAASNLRFDLCPDCYKSVAENVLVHGEPLSSRGKRLTRVELEPAPAKHRTAGNRKAKRVAKKTTPVSSYEMNELGQYVCPDCGFTGARPQSIGAHRAHAHGFRRTG